MISLETIQTKQFGEIRLGWIRILYGATAVLGISVGGTMLVAPDFSRKVVGIPFGLPPQDPITYGALAGIWATVGVLCLFGLRAPLQFLPIIAIQLIYKMSWFAFVFFPLILQGQFPNHGWASAVGNLAWILLDLKAMPWRYLFATDQQKSLEEIHLASGRAVQASQDTGSQAA